MWHRSRDLSEKNRRKSLSGALLLQGPGFCLWGEKGGCQLSLLCASSLSMTGLSGIISSMNILITNDDGIRADGLIRLARTASELGRVTVIAPEEQRSAMSHKITLREPIDVWKEEFPVPGVEAYATTGTPADCVRFGMLNIVKEPVDLVLSGINFGYNSGTDVQYSATIGAAMEAANTGVHAIALSEGINGCHEITDAHLLRIIEELKDRPLEYDQIWNVNFPQLPLSQYRGTLEGRWVAHNGFYHDRYAEERLPDGRLRLRVDGEYYEEAPEGSDVRAIIDGYISVGIVANLR